MNDTGKGSFKAFGCTTEKEVLDIVLNPKNGIKFIRVMFPDILGRPMDFSLPCSELESAFKEGKGFDGSSVEGFVRIEESDLVIKPDPASFRVLPWEYKGFDENVRWKEALLFGDIQTPDGKTYEGDSRGILKRILRKAKDEFGFDEFMCGPELEFFFFPSDRDTSVTDEGDYFFSGRYGELRKEIQLLLNMMGIETEYDHHEVAHGQHEIDLKYSNALEIADTAMIFRYMTKKVARMHGLYATFMPKPVNGQNGSGMHVHQSLWKNGKNVFFDPKGAYHLSDIARSYMAGLTVHAREISAVFNQWVNSYKRLIEGYEAPVYIAWGQKNRSAYIRVPEYQPGKEHATRIELRSPDPGSNIHLALSLMLNTGLEGIRKGYDLTDPVEENIYEMSNSRQKKYEIKTLPRNLEEAIRLMEKSDLVKATLGDHVFSQFLANKQREIEDYENNVTREYEKQVSEYEIKTYLPIL